MSNKTNDFIFCPFCGGVKWLTDKTRNIERGRLESHKCGACKKFIYTNLIESVKSPLGLDIFEKTRWSVDATILPYRISVFYQESRTVFVKDETDELVLSLDVPVTFNWYKNEELINKIKKYVVFS